jgi:hypothetical protein
MQIGDKCKYRDHDSRLWKEGVVLDVQGPYSARVYVITGTGHATGELGTRTSHYVMADDK